MHLAALTPPPLHAQQPPALSPPTEQQPRPPPLPAPPSPPAGSGAGALWFSTAQHSTPHHTNLHLHEPPSLQQRRRVAVEQQALLQDVAAGAPVALPRRRAVALAPLFHLRQRAVGGGRDGEVRRQPAAGHQEIGGPAAALSGVQTPWPVGRPWRRPPAPTTPTASASWGTRLWRPAGQERGGRQQGG